jgi:dUTPase
VAIYWTRKIFSKSVSHRHKAPVSISQLAASSTTKEGRKVEGPFTIKPGYMVQVVSSEVFSLSDRHTGHVTYKTTLTKKGIWALTVGIVDPGWDGPVATTLLNFSGVNYAISDGDPFLRVSLFEHDPVPSNKLRKAPPLDHYLKDIRKTAASIFPPTFLDSEKISEVAGAKVLERIRKEALVWVAAIAVLFTVLQWVNAFRPDRPTAEVTQKDLEALRAKIDLVQTRQLKLEETNSQVLKPPGPPPSVTPPPSRPANH